MKNDGACTPTWPTTHWPDVRAAGESVGIDAERLNALLLRYSTPLRAFLLSAFPALDSQHEELLQDFMLDRVLKADWLKRASRDKGKFRDYLKTSLRNFVRDRLRAQKAKPPPLALEDLPEDLLAEQRASEAFDVALLRELLAETLRRMEADCRDPAKDQPRRGHIWQMFGVRILQPLFEDVPALPYEQLVQRFGLRSPRDASNLLLSGKRIFKSHWRKVIETYEAHDAATASEMGHLVDSLAHLTGKKPGVGMQDAAPGNVSVGESHE